MRRQLLAFCAPACSCAVGKGGGGEAVEGEGRGGEGGDGGGRRGDGGGRTGSGGEERDRGVFGVLG